jgi:hypothetical protein
VKVVGVQRRNQAIIEIVGPAFAEKLRNSHNKGAGDYSIANRARAMSGILSAENIRQALLDHPDVRTIPNLNLALRLARERYGHAGRGSDCRDHLEQTIGFRAAYAGQVMLVDATGYPVVFRNGRVRGKQKMWIFISADVASAFLRVANRVATSESEGWRPKDDPSLCDVMLDFLRQMGHFPEWLVNDAISTLTEGLRYLHPGVHPAEVLSVGTLTILLGGTHPYVRMGERPTGGAHVESAVGVTKGALAEIGTRKAIEREARGEGLTKINYSDNELEWLARLTEAIAKVNASKLTRRDCPLTRADLYQKESAAAARDAWAVAPDLWASVNGGEAKYQQLVRQTKVGEIAGGRVSVRVNGKPWSAEIQDRAKIDCKTEGRYALILPPGARKDDDPESFRLIVIERDGSRVMYHPATAKTIQVDEYYQDMNKPLIGEYRRLPSTQQDDLTRARARDAAQYRKSLREGTNDAPVDGADSPF